MFISAKALVIGMEAVIIPRLILVLDQIDIG
jgi:hypothetical protein